MFNFSFKKSDNNNKETNSIKFICQTDDSFNPATIAELTASLQQLQKRHNQLNTIINMNDDDSKLFIREIV